MSVDKMLDESNELMNQIKESNQNDSLLTYTASKFHLANSSRISVSETASSWNINISIS